MLAAAVTPGKRAGSPAGVAMPERTAVRAGRDRPARNPWLARRVRRILSAMRPELDDTLAAAASDPVRT
ncbi:MAG TPA: hypothetical protein VFK02_31710, partial [Kofleriaceae bacterium]|nr:hypothetical protein [Kofleriaceae bacterium]